MSTQQHDPDQHILELMPWYTNGTLSDSEKSEVENYLATHPEHLQELEFLRDMQNISHDDIDVPEPNVARLMEKLDKLESDYKPSLVDKAKEILNSLFNPTLAWTAVPVALALAVALLWMPDQNSLNGKYETLSSGENPTATSISVTTTSPTETETTAAQMQSWLPAAKISMDAANRFVFTVPAETDASETLKLLDRMQTLSTVKSAELVSDK